MSYTTLGPLKSEEGGQIWTSHKKSHSIPFEDLI